MSHIYQRFFNFFSKKNYPWKSLLISKGSSTKYTGVKAPSYIDNGGFSYPAMSFKIILFIFFQRIKN